MVKKNRTFLVTIFRLLIGPFGKDYLKILGFFFFKYVPISYARGTLVNIASEIDNHIPERPVVKQYLDIFYFPFVLISEATTTHRTNLKLQEDIRRATLILEKIYLETCDIYKIKQSTLGRKPATHLSVKILHFFDQNRNCYPSLHAQILAEIYNAFLNYDNVIPKQELIKRIASILEACLLTKQHSINDIASGLAGVTILDPRFLRERAEELLSHVFLHQQYGMNLELCNTIRNNMVTLYRRLLDSSSTKSYREILLPFEALSN